jgi:hypothetical protein
MSDIQAPRFEPFVSAPGGVRVYSKLFNVYLDSVRDVANIQLDTENVRRETARISLAESVLRYCMQHNVALDQSGLGSLLEETRGGTVPPVTRVSSERDSSTQSDQVTLKDDDVTEPVVERSTNELTNNSAMPVPESTVTARRRRQRRARKLRERQAQEQLELIRSRLELDSRRTEEQLSLERQRTAAYVKSLADGNSRASSAASAGPKITVKVGNASVSGVVNDLVGLRKAVSAASSLSPSDSVSNGSKSAELYRQTDVAATVNAAMNEGVSTAELRRVLREQLKYVERRSTFEIASPPARRF